MHGFTYFDFAAVGDLLLTCASASAGWWWHIVSGLDSEKGGYHSQHPETPNTWRFVASDR
jgi:hypothetical protein